MSTAFTGQAIGVGFERQYGVLKRLGATPLPRSVLLLAKTLAVLAVELLQVALLSAVGLALGWDPRGSVARGARPGRARHGRLQRARPAARRHAARPDRRWPRPTCCGSCCWCSAGSSSRSRPSAAAEPVLSLLPTAALSSGLRDVLVDGVGLPLQPLARARRVGGAVARGRQPALPLGVSDLRSQVRMLQAASLTSAFDRFVVAPLLLTIAAAFDVGLAETSAVASLYYLTYGLSQPLWGLFSDRFGRVRTLRAALSGAAVLGVLSALAPSLELLVLARAGTGACIAAAVPSALVYIGDVVPFDRRQAVLTDLNAATAIGITAAIGLGGVLAAAVSWRVGFLLPAAAAGVLALVLHRLPEPAQAPGRTTGPGAALRSRWGRRVLLLALVEGAALLGLLTYLAPAVESRGASPTEAGGAGRAVRRRAAARQPRRQAGRGRRGPRAARRPGRRRARRGVRRGGADDVAGRGGRSGAARRRRLGVDALDDAGVGDRGRPGGPGRHGVAVRRRRCSSARASPRPRWPRSPATSGGGCCSPSGWSCRSASGSPRCSGSAAPRGRPGCPSRRTLERVSPSTVRRLALASVVANSAIVVTGGAVRLTSSGLGCPTWPRCTDDQLHADRGVRRPRRDRVRQPAAHLRPARRRAGHAPSPCGASARAGRACGGWPCWCCSASRRRRSSAASPS